MPLPRDRSRLETGPAKRMTGPGRGARAVCDRRSLLGGLALCAPALWLAGGPIKARAQEPTLRIGHFPNITHIQALVARAFERKGQGFLGKRLGEGVKLEWYTYNAGPSAMEAVFAKAIDL